MVHVTFRWLKDSYQVFHRLQLNDLHILNITGIPALLNLLEPLSLLLTYLTHLVQNLPRCILDSNILYLCHITIVYVGKVSVFFLITITSCHIFYYSMHFSCQFKTFHPHLTQKTTANLKSAIKRVQTKARFQFVEREQARASLKSAVVSSFLIPLTQHKRPAHLKRKTSTVQTEGSELAHCWGAASTRYLRWQTFTVMIRPIRPMSIQHIHFR